MIRIGVAIMHHPRRADRIPALVRACAPLVPAVVADPEPSGRPSPLRTAKRAWAAIDPEATHHLVLQDDVRLAPDFAGQVHEAVRHRPDHGVSLFSLWDTPHNSYLVRRAAVAGACYAPLSPSEWTPTQAFVLPADHARDLASYLAKIPDEVQDDDEMIVIFCRERGIPVVSTIPHLLDHGHETSLVAGHKDGLRATVYTPERTWSAEHASTDLELPPGTYTVALRDSICSLRLAYGDPVEHQFPWYWYDACPLTGLDPEAILEAATRQLSQLSSSTRYRRCGAAIAPTMTEVWAAGYLLGADVAAAAPTTADCGPFTAAVLESWIDQGLSAEDQRIDGLREDCVRLAMTAVQQGLHDRKRARCVPT